jgi:hypothetical protein
VLLVWLLAMIGLLAWLLWWDRADARDHGHVVPPFEAALDRAAARARNGDAESERWLWQVLVEDLSDYRDLRWALERIRERPHARTGPGAPRAAASRRDMARYSASSAMSAPTSPPR